MPKHLTLLLAAIVVVLPVVSHGEDSTAMFQDLYSKMKEAMSSRNGPEVSALLAPGFISEDVSGKTETADQMLAELAALPADPTRKSETVVVSASVQGNLADVLQRYHSTANKVSPDGQPKVTDIQTQSKDTWQLSGGSWRLLRTVTETLEYRVNGKVLVQRAHPSN